MSGSSKKGKQQRALGDRIIDIQVGVPLKRSLYIAALERNMRLNDYIIAVLQKHKDVEIPKNYVVVLETDD
jgi:hypothetical protein